MVFPDADVDTLTLIRFTNIHVGATDTHMILQTLTLHKQTLVWAFQFLPVQMLLDSKCKCLIDANDNNSSVLSHTSLWNHHIEAYSVVYHSGHIPFSLPVYLDCTGIRHFVVHSFH